jgi:peptide/nickel transport system substrate-binding protein
VRNSILALSASVVLALSASTGVVAQGASSQTAQGTFYGAYPYQVPPTGNFNYFSPNFDSFGIYYDLLQQPLARYLWANQSWYQILGTKWEFDNHNNTFTIHLRPGVKWSDGTSLTSTDVVDTFTLGKLMNWVVWSYVDKVEAQGQYTVVFHMNNPSIIVEEYVLHQNILPASTYGKLAVQVATLRKTDPKLTSAKAKDLTVGLEQLNPKQMVVDGPYNIDMSRLGSASATFDKNPTAWDAKQVKFNQIVLWNGETPTITPLVMAKEVDYATHGFPQASAAQFKKIGLSMASPPTHSGPAILFNWKLYPFNLPQVRQAIAYAINRQQNATAAMGPYYQGVKYEVGFADQQALQWMPKQAIAQLNPYNYDPTKAATLLTSIGFKKKGDTWYTDKGKPMNYELIVPQEYADWLGAAQDAANQLTKFGIKTTVRGITFTQEPINIRQGQFQMAINAWGAGDIFPHFAFVNDVEAFDPPLSQGPGMSLPLTQKVPGMGTVNFRDLIVQSGKGLDTAGMKAATTKMALAFNKTMPIVPLDQRFGDNPVMTNAGVTGWQLGSSIWKNDLYLDNPVVIQILNGTLRPTK